MSHLAFHIKLSETSEKGVIKWEDLICGTFFGELNWPFLSAHLKVLDGNSLVVQRLRLTLSLPRPQVLSPPHWSGN